MRTVLLISLIFSCLSGVSHAAPTDMRAYDRSVQELQHVHGSWKVETSFLKPDGSAARVASGRYRFEWVVRDRVLRGTAETPELSMTSGILFYVNESKALIEMVSVGSDGQLWVMSGPIGGDRRETGDVKLADGSVIRLRFTRSHIEPNRFESRMEVSSDSGKTWMPGNHQVFVRE